jgi:hypothetical protein
MEKVTGYINPKTQRNWDKYDRLAHTKEYLESFNGNNPWDFSESKDFSDKVSDLLDKNNGNEIKEEKNEIKYKKKEKNYYYEATIKGTTLDLIQERFLEKDNNKNEKKNEDKEIEAVKLSRKLVAFKGKTWIYLNDNNESVKLGGYKIIAMRVDNIDREDSIDGLDLFVYLGNLTNNLKIEKRRRTTYYRGRGNHPTNFPVNSTFFAKPEMAVKLGPSLYENSIRKKSKKVF